MHSDPPFLRLNPENYFPIRDHGLVGDGTTAALIARNGMVNFLCLPRFDGAPVFASLLDSARGGHFLVCPAAELESRQTYAEDAALLITEIRCATGLVRITDACTIQGGSDQRNEGRLAYGELLRRVEVLEGNVRLNYMLMPNGGAGATMESEACVRIRASIFPELPLRLACTRPLSGLYGSLWIPAGERVWFSLQWNGLDRVLPLDEAEQRFETTRHAWQTWFQRMHYEGPQAALVRRSAMVLHLLDYAPNGAMVAAPTSSLPERIGGERNWDYRFTWIRDAAFAVYALRRISLEREGGCFLDWVMKRVAEGRKPRVLYTLDGEAPPAERIDAALEGYRGSRPVRWGNAAASQKQTDIYGEILDCAWQRTQIGGPLEPGVWGRICDFVEAAAVEWNDNDHGIWEIRSDGRAHTYSAAMCQVALDRACRIAAKYDLPADIERWRSQSEVIRAGVIEGAWNQHREALCASLGGSQLDASVLSLPLRHVIAATHPRMVATVNAIEAELGAGRGLLYRYLPFRLPDGFQQEEGAFLLCSFWLVDNYTFQGRLDEANELFDSICARAGPLGLLPEQIDVSTGEYLGNYPQALSHVGVISSGINLHRAWSARR